MKKIIVDVAVEGTRVALLENEELVEFYMEMPESERLVGNIYRGRVSSVLPGMQAAFIDIGYEKNAFLYVDDAIADGDEVYHMGKKKKSIEKILKPGQEITVQVVKEPIDSKGPRVTTQITLPGRHLVMLPEADYIGVSRRITNDAERKRLREYANKVKPKDAGLIVRTASEGKTLQDFILDVSFLANNWKKIKKLEKRGKVPRCLHRELNLVYRTVRDLFTPDIDKFIINDKKEYKNVLELVDMLTPRLRNRVQYHNGDSDLFELYNIDAEITKALSRKVWLKCGGYIVIDKTEALTVIDVNTGKYVGTKDLEKTVLKTNLEAAEAIAKQIRLRDIGGIIIIDFIDMVKKSNQEKVLHALKQALKKDRTKTTVVGMTGLGLIEMTRKKVRQGLNTFLTTECPNCEGTGKIQAPEAIALRVEKKISEYANKRMPGKLRIEVHPSIAALLMGKDGKNIRTMQKAYGKRLTFVPNEELDYNEVIINGNETHKILSKC